MARFFVIAICIWVTAHLYVGTRLIHGSHLRTRWKIVAWAALLTMMTLGPSALFIRGIPHKGTGLIALEWASYLSMGFFLILLPSVLVRDLGWLVGAAVDSVVAAVRRVSLARRRVGVPARSVLPVDPDRRRFLLQSMNVGLVGFSGTLTGFGVYEARRTPDVVRVDIPIVDLPPDLAGFRIAQITDTHVGPMIRREMMQEFVAVANALEPDMIAVTGDLADGYLPEMRPHVEPVADLRAPHGVYFVTGNHEYYWDYEGWIAEVRRLGLTVLLNEHRVLERGSGRILLAGVTDYSAGRYNLAAASDPMAALAGAPRADVKIVLAHQPKSIYEVSDTGYDLQISGHTHGGQFFPWGLFVHLLQPYVAGLHRHGNTWIYVSRGTGYWGPPLRIAAPPEITLLTLVRGDAAG